VLSKGEMLPVHPLYLQCYFHTPYPEYCHCRTVAIAFIFSMSLLVAPLFGELAFIAWEINQSYLPIVCTPIEYAFTTNG
jgi:hypothetical protein